MATTKKPTAKAAKVGPSIEVEGHSIPKMTLNFGTLNATRIKAIQKCIEKGELRVTVSNVDLSAGRIGDGWLYD
jgi:hypothetical protein